MTAGPLTPVDPIRLWRDGVERAVPGLVTLALIVVMTAPLFVAVPAVPNLALLGVFVWASFQPGLMPPWLAFGLGGIADLLFGLPLGVEATLLAAVAIFVRVVDARFAEHRYAFDWLFAAVVVVAAAVAEWQLLALAGVVGPLVPLFLQAVTTILAYPAVVALLARIQRRLAAR